MGLDVPELDDRTYEDFVAEARNLIPAFSEEWTDHNPHDPGITILETLAWVSETYIYQLDQITDEHREKYLRLLGATRRPPQAATAQVALEAPGPLDSTLVPAGTGLAVSDGSGSRKAFETVEDVVVTGADVVAVKSVQRGAVAEHTHANRTTDMSYRPLGENPSKGDALYLGFDGDPVAGAPELSIWVEYDDAELPEPAGTPVESSTFEPSVDLVWEYCRDYTRWRDADAWADLPVRRDGTDALYDSGRITFDRPAGWQPANWEPEAASVLDADAGRFWIRCRVRQGGYEIPPQVEAIGTNVLDVAHRSTVTGERLGRARGNTDPVDLTDQTYVFDNAPVLSATVTVDGEPWTEVPDLDASGPRDPHYVLDAAAGEVRFGDGIDGLRPDPDAVVEAKRYVHGGGAEGNVPADSSWRFREDESPADGLSDADLRLQPLGPATGGTDGESIAEAVSRVRADLRETYRAVTPADYEAVATSTPGLRFGRATVTVDEPADGDAPTAATVTVVPYAPADVTAPTPSEGFLAAVRDHVEARRLLTDRVTVAPPTYVGLDVTVRLRTTGDSVRPGLAESVETALESFLDPLRGLDGDGWPFGRSLYRSDLVERLSALEWVDSVQEVSVTPRGDARVDGEGTVHVGGDALFSVNSVSVDLGAGDESDPEPTDAGESEQELSVDHFQWGG